MNSGNYDSVREWTWKSSFRGICVNSCLYLSWACIREDTFPHILFAFISYFTFPGLHFGSHVAPVALGVSGRVLGTTVGFLWPHTPKNHKQNSLTDIIFGHLLIHFHTFLLTAFRMFCEALVCVFLAANMHLQDSISDASGIL